jgi:outer membrane protein assembly factor BamB
MLKKSILLNLCWSFILLLSACTGTQSKYATRQIESTSLPIDLIWQAEIDEPVASPPQLSSQIVVVFTYRALYGLDPATGQRLWKYRFRTAEVSSQPFVVTDDKVIYGSSRGQLIVLDANSGEMIWRYTFPGENGWGYDILSVKVDDQAVYISSQPRAVKALDLATGD